MAASVRSFAGRRVVGRPANSTPVQAPVAGMDGAVWGALERHFGSKLALGQASGFAVRVCDRWSELNASRKSPVERIEALIVFAVELGAIEREARAVVEHTRQRVQSVGIADLGERRRRHEQVRRDLSA
jgi:hypothetical protein